MLFQYCDLPSSVLHCPARTEARTHARTETGYSTILYPGRTLNPEVQHITACCRDKCCCSELASVGKPDAFDEAHPALDQYELFVAKPKGVTSLFVVSLTLTVCVWSTAVKRKPYL